MFLGKRFERMWGGTVRRCVAGTLVASAALCFAETPPKPALRVPLSELGFPGYAVSLFHAGASMATVHMLDASHVLFTYSLRSLVPRLPGDDANDSDRQVAAVLIEVPTGKVLARTRWHLHDHARYLWSVGGGVFVVRMGSDLSLFSPLQALAAGDDPFQRYALPHRPGVPVAVQGSPDGKLLTVELESEKQAASDENSEENANGNRKHKHYIVEFFRMVPGATSKDPMRVEGAGAVGSPMPLRLPMDGDGYLWAEDNQRGKWTVSFNEFGGKQQRLTPLMSSCHPRLSLLSRSQFLAETCRGTDEQPMLAAYGFDGHENWQEPFGEALQPPTIALAPVAGRFAMSRLVASAAGAPVSGLVNDDPLSQEIRVYQTESGDMLLHLQCSPAVRSSENFDLSPDGKTLAVLGPQTLDLYRLPELSDRDRKDLAEIQAMTPPEGHGPVLLGKITRPIEASQQVGGGDEVAGTHSAPASAPPAAAAAEVRAAAAPASNAGPAAGPAQATAASAQDPGTKTSGAPSKAGIAAAEPAGDPVETGPRKPPSLLNPGESPEFKGQSAKPQ